MSETNILPLTTKTGFDWNAARRVSIIVIICVIVFLAGGILWFGIAARASFPKLDGTHEVRGLSAPVQVLRDGHGVPTIRAANAEDLFFSQGYVTAQDRLWQMDMTRRYGAGELSAALGSSTVEVDREQRILGLRQVAERAVAQLSPQDRARFDAYARGVNAYIADHRYSLPLEFRVLRYFPRAWTPEDSFLIAGVMMEMLNHGEYRSELSHEAILAKAGPEIADDLFPEALGGGIAPSQDTEAAAPVEASQPEQVAPEEKAAPEKTPAVRRGRARRRARVSAVRPRAKASRAARHRRARAELRTPQLPFNSFDPLVAGSNNWVVSGAHTASGKPLLSNDMHLGHQIPNTWYEAHLAGGEFDVAGVTLPGIPGVVVGHNQRIAWGFTNLGPDVQDLYVENFNSQGQYQTPDGWKQPEVRHEVIHVKHGKDVTIDVIETRHGPIVTPLIKGETRQLALRWTAREPNASSWVFFNVDTAQNWDQFQSAFSQFGAPGQNVVYADVDGNIGYHATGLVPIRASGDGTLPVSGADDAHEWTGYIPFDQLPHVLNPPSGIIGTANARVTPDGYTGLITKEWASPYRAERIYQVLRMGDKFTPADMLALQNDVYSEVDKVAAERFVYAIDRAGGNKPKLAAAAEILRKWDGRMDANSAAAAIEFSSRRTLQQMLLESKLGPNGPKLYSWYAAPVWMEDMLLAQPDRWLPSNYQSWDALLIAAVEKSLKDAPSNLSKWKYGEVSQVEISHQVFGRIPILRRWAGTGALPQSGNGLTVKQVGRSFGPSERFTVDFSNFDRSTLNIVNGQSGILFSPYFNDQWKSWYAGTTLPFPYTSSAVEQTTVHRLTLTPAR